ncbi:MAG: hypothetical protein HQL06_16170 [Nitrospirae bacterium]|nr:hypothetical protein [Nitrospirota bacterium]
MKRVWGLVAAMFLTVVVFSNFVLAEGEKGGASVKEGSVVYVCDCGKDCHCKDEVSTQPGKCSCGHERVPMHVLKIDGNETVLCTCGKDCQCKLDPNDPAKCTCGKQVKKVSLKGLYVCACGPSCSCNTVSDKPGKCKCGAELRKVD